MDIKDIIPYNEKPDIIQRIENESKFWQAVFSIPTPPEAVHERIGPGGEMLEYIKSDYTMDMLNKLFPGWRQEEMDIFFVPEVATWVCKGYIVVNYPTAEGMKERKIWAVGAAQVLPKKEKSGLPSQPDDMAKAAYTEWIKLAGRRLGIGADVYDQIIPKQWYDEYESIVSDWDYHEITDSIVATIEEKKVFRKYIDNLPTEQQVENFKKALEKAPAHLKKPLWEQFQKHNKKTVDVFIKQIISKLNEMEENNGQQQNA